MHGFPGHQAPDTNLEASQPSRHPGTPISALVGTFRRHFPPLEAAKDESEPYPPPLRQRVHPHPQQLWRLCNDETIRDSDLPRDQARHLTSRSGSAALYRRGHQQARLCPLLSCSQISRKVRWKQALVPACRDLPSTNGPLRTMFPLTSAAS